MIKPKMAATPEFIIDWKFKKALAKKNVTLSWLHESTGIHKNILSMYATGRYNLTLAEKDTIAKALQMRPRDIFSR